MPTNPKILKEIIALADNNYKLNKVSFWDEDEENDNKLKLSLAWLNLSKIAKNKLGIEYSSSTINNLVNYLNKNSNLKWDLIVFAAYVLLFSILGILNLFID